MDSHIQGPILGGQNLGAVISQRIFPIAYNDRGEANVKLCTVDATQVDPVFVTFDVVVTEPFDAGSTNTLVIGNTSVEDEYYAAGDINESATGSASTKKFFLTEKTTITRKYSQTGTAATAGKAYLIVSLAGSGKGKEISY